jgi:hypothetical protein
MKSIHSFGWLFALLVVSALVVGACDPMWAIVAENNSGQTLLARLHGASTGDGTSVDLVVELPSGSRITLGENGVARQWLLQRVEILDPSCAVLAVVDTTDWDHGGLISVGKGPLIESTAGGNPESGTDGSKTPKCAAAT